MKAHKWELFPADGEVSMASTSLHSNVREYCITELILSECTNSDVRLSVFLDLCTDVILGHGFRKQHTSVEIPFGVAKPPLTVCGLATVTVSPPSLFANVTSNCKPIAVKFRCYTSADTKFIEDLEEDFEDTFAHTSAGP